MREVIHYSHNSYFVGLFFKNPFKNLETIVCRFVNFGVYETKWLC